MTFEVIVVMSGYDAAIGYSDWLDHTPPDSYNKREEE